MIGEICHCVSLRSECRTCVVENAGRKKEKRRADPSLSTRRFKILLRASILLSPVPSVPLPSATPFGQAIWHFEQPIALAARGTPRRRQSRRLASVGSKPPGPRNETLRNAN